MLPHGLQYKLPHIINDPPTHTLPLGFLFCSNSSEFAQRLGHAQAYLAMAMSLQLCGRQYQLMLRLPITFAFKPQVLGKRKRTEFYPGATVEAGLN